MANDHGSNLKLGPRVIPLPTSISEQARKALSESSPVIVPNDFPPISDFAAWHTLIEKYDAGLKAMLEAMLPPDGFSEEKRDIAGVPVYVAAPNTVTEKDPRVFLDFHGGGFVFGGGKVCALMARLMALRTGVRVWSVDYRMPPDHPYPAGLNDGMAVYRELLKTHRPENIIVGGISAGGNLSPALILRARDEGLPMPAAAVLQTPAVDLTCSGDSFETLRGIDPILGSPSRDLFALYANGTPLNHPYVSPLFGSFDAGFPPTFLQSGTRDLLLSSTVSMHRALRRAGIEAELHVFEAMPHGGFGGAPEDMELVIELRKFLAKHW
jgi:acetyl esterase/lipase